MLRRTSWVALLVMGGLTAAAAGEGRPVKLQWKFKVGDKFYVENIAKQKQTLKLAQMTVNQTATTTIVYRYTVEKKTKASAVLKQEILSATLTSNGELGGVDKLVEQMKGAVFTLTLGSSGKVEKFEGYDALLKKLTKDDEKKGKMFALMIPKEGLGEEAAELFGSLPEKAVVKGDKWKRTQKQPLGPLGTFKANNTYTFLGETKKGAQIGVTATTTYSPPAAGNDDVPLKITKGNLKAESFKSTILFDAARGRMVHYKGDMAIKGSLTADVMGNSIEMEVAIKINATMRITDKAPSDD